MWSEMSYNKYAMGQTMQQRLNQENFDDFEYMNTWFEENEDDCEDEIDCL